MANKKMPSDILVAVAVSAEAEGIHHRMDAVKASKVGGRSVFSGTIGKTDVRLMITGPGMVNTAQGLTAAIEHRSPAMILMTGCGGGFVRAGMAVGDIAVATEENDAHLGIESEIEGDSPAALPFDLAVLGGQGVGHRVALGSGLAASIRDALRAEFSGMPFRIQTGPFVTVATITATERGAGRLYDRFRPCMENMEGVAAALVAGHYGIPFAEIRCASNLTGKRDRGAWRLSLACGRSAAAAVAWLRGAAVIPEVSPPRGGSDSLPDTSM